MKAFIENLLTWADQNDMQINTTKTKEMILGPLARRDIPILSTAVGSIDRVSSFKLLGIYIESTFCWSLHVDNMVKKATQRLYFLKQLKRAGLSCDHLFHFYTTVICPVLEYCVPVWHYVLTKAQTEQLEAVQKRAIHIILNFSRGMPCVDVNCSKSHDSGLLQRGNFQEILHSNYTTHFLFASPPP